MVCKLCFGIFGLGSWVILDIAIHIHIDIGTDIDIVIDIDIGIVIDIAREAQREPI